MRSLHVKGGQYVAGLLALFFILWPTAAYAQNGNTPDGWEVQVVDWTHQANYVEFNLILPPGATGVHVYEYNSLTATAPYADHRYTDLTPDSNGEVHIFVFDMLGGGYDTYMKMTPIWADGTEDPQPANYFVLQLDISVWIDGISKGVLQQLQDALDNLKNNTGVGDVISAGQALQSAISGVTNFSGAGSGDLAFTVPIVHPSDFGQRWAAVDVTVLSADQLQRLTWLSIVRSVLVAAMWIIFVCYLIVRFTPLFKV